MKQNNTNKTFKTELEKLKQMSIEDRLWYIWEYYKLQIFAFFLQSYFSYMKQAHAFTVTFRIPCFTA